MALPGIKLVTVDGNLALVSSAADKALVIGTCSKGPVNVVTPASQPKAISDTFGRGPLATCGGHIVDVMQQTVGSGSVDLVKAPASVAGVISAVTQNGGGPAVTVTITSVAATQTWVVTETDTTPVFADETADMASTTAADVDLFDAADVAGDYLAMGFSNPFNAIAFVISTSGVGGAGAWEYWNGSAWTAVSGLTDGTTGFTAAPGAVSVSFTMPTDWVTLSINGSAKLYFLRFRVTSAYSTQAVLTSGLITGQGPHDFTETTVEIVAGGILGTATFRYSLDNENTWSATRTVPASGSFDVPDAGMSLTFAAGTHVAGTRHTFTTKPPTSSASDLAATVTALLSINDRWKFAVFTGRAADATTAATLAAAIAGHMTSLANDERLLRGFVDMGDDTEANRITAFDGVDDLRLARFNGDLRLFVANPIEGWRKPMLPYIYAAAARQASFTRGTNIGWVGGKKLQRAGIGITDASFDEANQGEQLHNKRHNGTTTITGLVGWYPVNGLLAAPAGSDFRYIHWGIAFDLLCEIVIDALKPYINATIPVKDDGTGQITAVMAARINKDVNARIRAAVLEPLTEQPGVVGFFSAAAFAIDETWNVLTSKTLKGDTRAVPHSNTEQVDITAGLYTSINAEQPAGDEEEAA